MIQKTVCTLLFFIPITAAFVACGGDRVITADCDEYPVGVTTTLIGRTKYDTLYEVGTVLVRYEDHIQERRALSDHTVPAPAVNDFFAKKGFTPKVVGMLQLNEVIYIGKDVNAKPMLEDLARLPGVIAADLVPLYSTSNLIIEAQVVTPEGGGGSRRKASTSAALIEVGKMKDGTLYDLGSILVRYQKSIVTVPGTALSADRVSLRAVKTFFSDRGYNIKRRNLHERVEIIYIDVCADLESMLEELKEVPGVTDARLDIIYTFAELTGGVATDLTPRCLLTLNQCWRN